MATIKSHPRAILIPLPLQLVNVCTGTVAFVTEASLFADAGVPAIVCGPGDIAQAHQPDEFIEITQLDSCLGFLERIALPS